MKILTPIPGHAWRGRAHAEALAPSPPSGPARQRCLSVNQPWAWALFDPVAGKDIENRCYAIPPGPLLIHASITRRNYRAGADWMREKFGLVAPPMEELPGGAIIGRVEVTGSAYAARGDGRWGQAGSYHNHISQPQLLPDPVPWRGRQGLFHVILP